jgi:transcriptional regulator with XRE-family HTH domain
VEKEWFFGAYLQRLLDRKGWKLLRLKEESKVSYSHLYNLLKGEDPKTGRPTSIGVDKLNDIANALNVPIGNLVAAYFGQDPEKMPEGSINTEYKAFLEKILMDMPPELLIQALKTKYPEPGKLDEIKKKVLDE